MSTEWARALLGSFINFVRVSGEEIGKQLSSLFSNGLRGRAGERMEGILSTSPAM